jgi:hypothetical protein
VLFIGILQMYNGIEIEHPVFRVLFCNLIVTFFSSTVNIIAYPIGKNIRYSTIVNGNNAFCLLFHCCCWFVVSVLRYLYIIHKDWILAKPCCADSPDSPTFAEPCCADSPDSPTLAKGHFQEKCDLPRQIRASKA